MPAQLPRRDLSSGIRSPLAHEAGLGAERRGPGCDVRRLPTGADVRFGHAVVAQDERTVEPDDHVQEQIAESREAHN